MLLLLQTLLSTLPGSREGLFNQWMDRCPQDTSFNGPEARRTRLAAHLDCAARLIVVGEFGGHLGSRHSGIAFTSERQLLKGGLPRIPKEEHRLTTAPTPMVEPTGTIVWRTLCDQKIADTTILWNVLPMHPHRPGRINTNRKPSPHELKIGYAALEILVRRFPEAKVVAMGKMVAESLEFVGARNIVTSASPGHSAQGDEVRFDEAVRPAARIPVRSRDGLPTS